MMTVIARLPSGSRRRRRFCIGCGIRFEAAHTSHQLCQVCFRWHLVIRSVRIVNRVLREERR